jgi:hypothetical protein
VPGCAAETSAHLERLCIEDRLEKNERERRLRTIAAIDSVAQFAR